MLCIKPGTNTSYFTIPQCDGLWDKCKITQDTLIDTDFLCARGKRIMCVHSDWMVYCTEESNIS
jgi:hypothetical protein